MKVNAPARRKTFTRYRVTWATYGLVGYFAYLETVLGPLMPFLRAEQGLSYTVASLHFSAFALGGVVVGLIGERVEERWGRTMTLWGGGAGMAAGTLLLTLASAAPGTISGAFVMGFFGSLLLITTQAVLSDRHGTGSVVAITESNVAASVCAILASLAVGFFAASGLGWRSALVPPMVALVLLAANFRREPLEGTRRKESAQQEASFGLPRRFWIYWGVLVLGVSVEWCIAYWGADFLENAGGMGRSGAAAALTTFFVAMLAGRIAGSGLARVLPGAILLTASLSLALSGFPLLWLAPAPVGSMLGLSLTGLGVGCVYPLGISVAVSSAPGRLETATARLALGAAGAILVAPFVLGALADLAGITGAFGIVLPLLLFAVALTLVGHRAPMAPSEDG
ncbi:MAG: MFS transporter [Actinomycetota bacterium]|nr:MFS transporter [Actinomycetota bacterium]